MENEEKKNRDQRPRLSFHSRTRDELANLALRLVAEEDIWGSGSGGGRAAMHGDPPAAAAVKQGR